MAISERINPDQLNIHQFQEMPEVSRPELPFDVDRDISPETKEKIVTFVDENKFDSFYPWYAKNLALLWPDQKGLVTQTAQESWKLVAPNMIRLDTQEVISDLYSLKLIYPDFNAPLSNADWNYIDLNLKRFFKKERSAEGDPLAVLSMMYRYKVLNPESEYELTPEEIERLKKRLIPDDIVKNVHIHPTVQLKTLDPSFAPQLSSGSWEQLRNRLTGFESNGEWFMYTDDAAAMKLLAAHSLKITAPGVIEFQMYPPEDINTSTPPIPEVRKF